MTRKTPPSTAPAADAKPEIDPRSKYKPEFAAVAQRLCSKLGFTDFELGQAFGVSERTVKNWREAFPEFAAACAIGKDVADDRVEASLYQRANGYSFESEKVFCYNGKIVRAPIVEHVPPDTFACFKWLVNRRPDQWRDKIDVNATVRPAEVSGEPMSLDDFDKRYGSGARPASH